VAGLASGAMVEIEIVFAKKIGGKGAKKSP
jgi:hypothetical protein